MSTMFTHCEIQRLQFVDYSYPRLQDWRLWNNQRLRWFLPRMFSFISNDWD